MLKPEDIADLNQALNSWELAVSGYGDNPHAVSRRSRVAELRQVLAIEKESKPATGNVLTALTLSWKEWLDGYMTALNEQLKNISPFLKWPLELTDLTPEGQAQLRTKFKESHKNENVSGPTPRDIVYSALSNILDNIHGLNLDRIGGMLNPPQTRVASGSGFSQDDMWLRTRLLIRLMGLSGL